MQMRWLSLGAEANPFARYNPLRPLIHWYNARGMNEYVLREIDARYKRLLESDKRSAAGAKSIIDLFLAAYLSDNAAKQNQSLDETSRRFTMNQIKLFLFSGHDTTRSTMCYIFYIRITKPAILSRLRAEHDPAFCQDASKSAALLQNTPIY